jgi:hypothetical protein
MSASRNLRIFMTLIFGVLLVCPTSAFAGSVRPGFNSSNLPRNDDGSTGFVLFGFTINLFGTNYSGCYVNNNGNITFTGPLATYVPSDIAALGIPIIAPYWTDVDTRPEESGIVHYGPGTVGGRPAWAATWDHVTGFGLATNLTNTFQVVIIDRSDLAPGAFDIEFNYDSIQFDTATGGIARAGYTNGSTVSYEVPGSGVSGAFLDSNPDGLIHRDDLLFSSVGGAVTSPPSVITTNVSDVVGNSATLNASVNPNNLATSVYFEYGTHPALTGASITSSQGVGGGGLAVAVSYAVTNLPSGTYYFRAIGVNSAGTTISPIINSFVIVASPEIAVFNGGSITADELTDAQFPPVSFANTNLGATTTRTFTVANIGTANLTLGAITIDGPNAGDFTVTTAPTSPVAGPSGTTTFVVTFAPLTAGTKTAALHLVNNDADENPFDINLSGFGVLSPPIVVTSGSSGITAYTATVSGSVNPNYGASSAWFEYSADPTLTTGVLSTPAQAIPYGFVATGISAALANLLAEQGYAFRAVASNDAGTTRGNILSFTTSYPVATNDSFDASTGLIGGGDIYRPVPGVINAAGRVSFRASLIGGVSGVSSANDALMLSDSSGTLRVIAQEGTAVPGGGTLGGFFQYPTLTPAGLTVMRERFSGVASTVDYAYLASDDGISTSLLSREGDTAPNGGVFTGHAGQPSSDDQERVYFNGALSGVASTRNSGIWYDAGGTLSKLVQEGDNVSTLMGDSAWLGNISPTTSAAGDGVAFVAALQKNPANKLQTTAAARNQALIGGAPGSLAVIARKGDVIPGVGKIKSFTGVSRSSAGDHAFMSALSITTTAPAVTKLNDQVLLAKIGSTVHVVARENTTEVIPASGLRTARFGHFYAAGDGSVLFQAWLAGTGVTTANDGVVCRWSVASGIEVLAREGSAAPGTSSTYTAFTGFSVSPGGAVALTATLANKRIVLLRALPGDDLTFVTQTTASITFNGAPRKILSLGIHTTGTGAGHGGNGKGAAINDAGDVFTVLSIGGGEYIARIFKLP